MSSTDPTPIAEEQQTQQSSVEVIDAGPPPPQQAELFFEYNRYTGLNSEVFIDVHCGGTPRKNPAPGKQYEAIFDRLVLDRLVLRDHNSVRRYLESKPTIIRLEVSSLLQEAGLDEALKAWEQILQHLFPLARRCDLGLKPLTIPNATFNEGVLARLVIRKTLIEGVSDQDLSHIVRPERDCDAIWGLGKAWDYITWQPVVEPKFEQLVNEVHLPKLSDDAKAEEPIKKVLEGLTEEGASEEEQTGTEAGRSDPSVQESATNIAKNEHLDVKESNEEQQVEAKPEEHEAEDTKAEDNEKPKDEPEVPDIVVAPPTFGPVEPVHLLLQRNLALFRMRAPFN